MFESIEIRPVKNGFIVTVTTEEDTAEYIFDSARKFLKFVKEYAEAAVAAETK